ncbi:hypothetical protein H6G20_14695 [Desertifilum sp. FACHB-1129]|uniref:Uncharacterized protein n=2 Tax=Desertifilum tharense IPPAS B-1220 TaxID=1781255 RepID=A0A1E5QP43_9CYAN|nr:MULTISPECIES: hypothetical protein [Desertifilum]MBD2312917.1 hypothetical protein [Desertifilum sp. FACHB-1129]MBD2323794.1 hypothetical protein [Desertifilum sp. FACHB-866]MDA0210672.1 hypothetical protein [Cyanobacteria bacterium FC1]OEJ76426.1 hypothetical protein BH720_04445 [Desertifilum tharense IPPAS B-1220]
MNQNSKPQKNLVMGLVKTYNFEKIKPFLLSLRNTGYEGDICFLVGDLAPETIAGIREFGVDVQAFNELYFQLPLYRNGKWAMKKIYPYHRLVNLYPINRLNYWIVKKLTTGKRGSYRTKAQIASLFVHVMCVRYPLYYLYLSKYGHQYDKIMLTDVRDVIFQRDPFDFEIGDRLCCFFEEEGKTLDVGDANTEWIAQGFGTEALQEIGHCRTSCSGTTIGSRDAILNYLEVMIDRMLALKCHTWGIDQGVHNYILHKGLVPNVKFYNNYQGPILTMHYSEASKLKFNEQGYLVNEDGSTINVLHQYDRQSPEIKSQMTVYQRSECVC